MLEPVTLDVANATRVDYRRFISEIRSRICGTPTMVGGSEFLVTDSSRTGSEWYLPIRIHVRSIYIEVYMRSSDLYLVGYRHMTEEWQSMPQSTYHHFAGTDLPPNVDSDRTSVMTYGENYSHLETAAWASRLGLSVNRHAVDVAVGGLSSGADPARAHGILVLSQVIAESARFHRISNYLANIWMTGDRDTQEATSLTRDLVTMENNWSGMSGDLLNADWGNRPPVAGASETSSNIEYFLVRLALVLGSSVAAKGRGKREAPAAGVDDVDVGGFAESETGTSI